MPCYNVEKTVQEAIESVLNQSYSNFVFKIINDCSPDNTDAVIRTILNDPSKNPHNIQIEYIMNKENRGIIGNTNYSIEIAQGKYLLICHADDVFHPDLIEREVEALEAYPSASFVSTRALLIDENSKTRGERFFPYEFRKRLFNELSLEDIYNYFLKYNCFITSPSVMARVDIYQQKVKRWNPDLGPHADTEAWFQLGKYGTHVLINLPLIKYRESFSSFSFNHFKERIKQHDFFDIMDEQLKKVDELGIKLSKNSSRYYGFLQFKDWGLRYYNLIKLKKEIPPIPKYNILNILRTAVETPWHFNYFIKSFSIHMVAALLRSVRGLFG